MDVVIKKSVLEVDINIQDALKTCQNDRLGHNRIVDHISVHETLVVLVRVG